jgi:hypothetical protein
MSVGAHDFPGVFVHEARPIWTLQFNDDGSYVFRVNDVADATGTYTVNGELYTEDTDYAPCSQARVATYRYRCDDGRLVFQLRGEDHCTERRASLDGVTWIRRE